MRNAEIATMLDEIADFLELKGETRYRITAYRQAARSVESTSEDLADLWAAGRLEQLYGIGPSIAAKIAEYLETGSSSYLESLRGEMPQSVREMLKVPGLGTAKAHMIHKELGINTVAELKEAAERGMLQTLPGIKAKTEEKILREIERYEQRGQRMLLGTALPAAEEVVRLLQDHPDVRRIQTGGSLRRMKETIGDIDLIVSSEKPGNVTAAFTQLPMVKEIIGAGHTKASILTRDNLQIDLLAVQPEQFGSALQHFTGSKEHAIALRDIAIQRGYKLNEYGLFNETTGERLAGEEEEDIYAAFGMRWMPPEIRENRGELAAAATGRLPDLVELEDIRGDLQMHTNLSDGTTSLERMAEACIARGYQYAAITDHSRSLTIAGGVPVERMLERIKEIEELNAQLAPFRLLASSEVDILPDGSLDYPDELLARLDLVVVSVHSRFKQTREEMTARIVRALENPHVDMLAHPTGRLLMRRDSYQVDLDQILRAAADRGVALEINASPERLDLDDIWARRAKEMGIPLAINTDAHSVSQLDFMRYGVAVARRGWVEKKDVVNALPLEQLLARRRHTHLRRVA